MKRIIVLSLMILLLGWEYNTPGTNTMERSAGGEPFGEFATPQEGETVSGSVALTGWALDDGGVQNVKIYREEGSSLVYIGDAVFVEGARPDVESAYPGYPNNSAAGWGYMMLTHFFTR